MECEAERVYNPCATACPLTCADSDGTDDCPGACIETCECPEGTVLDGNTCIAPSQCGCSQGGFYYSPGDSWITEDCSLSCQCVDGRVECVAENCDLNADCNIRNGERGCYCRDGWTTGEDGSCSRAPAYCTVWGDPHYLTFDDRRHNFQGVCEYTLVTDCRNDNSQRPRFQVTGLNVKNKPSQRVSYTRQINFHYANHTFTLLQRGEVRYNGVTFTPPLSTSDGVYIISNGVYVLLWTDFNLVIRWDGSSTVEIQLPYEYWNTTCGLCGDFDSNKGNDLDFQRDGSPARDEVEFGNSWVVDGTECDDSGIIIVDPCSEEEAPYKAAEDLCYALISPTGALVSCHEIVDPDNYYEACLYDLCATLPDDNILCGHLQEYAQACRERGGSPGNWREETPQCPMECEAERVYNPCATACPLTCADSDGTDDCPGACIETCECPEGTVLDGNTCIAPSQCGCSQGGFYYSPGDSWITEDCSLSCQCVDGRVECVAENCDLNADCNIRNGERGCYCRDGWTTGEDGSCSRAPAYCTVWGDPHYLTFDDRRHNFQGVCEYTLVTDCRNDNSQRPRFQVTGLNVKNKPSQRVSYTRQINFHYANHTFTLLQRGEVRYNGVTFTPPLSTSDGVYIISNGVYVLLWTDFNLVIRWDGSSTVEIQLPYEYWNTTCGLCGDFDSNKGNDLDFQRDGSPVR
ncbi:zonadhesin-like [Antedon mediterranea]|uniref:zonadhesin-like n=1 Tax=Antedon mediterranea TaxID=105859 RepID=UPI003AF8AD5D